MKTRINWFNMVMYVLIGIGIVNLGIKISDSFLMGYFVCIGIRTLEECLPFEKKDKEL